ncbi:LiaF transmembrane domain-containing protein [Marinifilum sp.]|uniref:LiaF transmembrane domain-containing protein n=1 Tax=Marinifilum sp. TaxID=2033137 RepID=UPI003BAABDF9
MDEHSNNRGLFAGILLITVGLVVMFERLDWYSDFIWAWLYRWESLLIFIGLILILVRKRFFGGMVAILAGGYFLMDEMLFLPQNWEVWVLPVALILGGAAFVFQPASNNCKK